MYYLVLFIQGFLKNMILFVRCTWWKVFFFPYPLTPTANYGTEAVNQDYQTSNYFPNLENIISTQPKKPEPDRIRYFGFSKNQKPPICKPQTLPAILLRIPTQESPVVRGPIQFVQLICPPWRQRLITTAAAMLLLKPLSFLRNWDRQSVLPTASYCERFCCCSLAGLVGNGREHLHSQQYLKIMHSEAARRSCNILW